MKFNEVGNRLYTGETSVDFVGKRKLWYVISLIIIAVAAFGLFGRGLNLGIEFEGGAKFNVPSTVSVEEARNIVKAAGVPTSVIIAVGNERLEIQTPPLEAAEIESFTTKIAEDFKVDAGLFIRHLERSKAMHHYLSKLFMERSLHKAKNYLNVETAAAIVNMPKLGLFDVLNDYHTKHIKHPQLVQYFNRFATYNGSNPYLAPATLHIIPHLEHGIGAFFPVKGMYQITDSLYKLALKVGVKFHLNSKVNTILVDDKKAYGVTINEAEIKADIVVSNMDVYHTYKKLLPQEKHPEQILKQEKSSSALIFFWGMNTTFEQLNLHNIFFSDNYEREFEGIEKSAKKRLQPWLNNCFWAAL